jgi:hypothetical protein
MLWLPCTKGNLQRRRAPYTRNRPLSTHTLSTHIVLHEAASRYLKEHLNGRTEIPLKKWRAERGRLTAEKSVLTRKYATLKEEVRNVETVRKYAEEVQHAIAPPIKSRSDLNR